MVRFLGFVCLTALCLSAAESTARMALTAETVGSDPAQLSQSPPDNGSPLTLDQALELAEKANPVLRGAVGGTALARAGITTARQYINPDFQFLIGPQRARRVLNPGVPGTLTHYSVSQPVELPAVRRTRIRVAEINQQTGQYNLAAVRRAIRAEVKRAFYEVLHRKEEIEHANENLKIVEDFRRRIGVQVQVGEAAKLELTRADAEIATAQTLVKTARIEYISAVSALRAAVSAPLPDNVDPVGSLTPPQTLPPLDQLLTQAIPSHPVLQQARSEVERSKAAIESERAQRVPRPAFYAEYEHQPDLTFYRFGLNLDIPAWNQRKGEIAEARAQLTIDEAVASQRALELKAALERAYGLYQVAGQQVYSFEHGALQQAEAALRAAQAAYRFGERGMIDVLDAQRVLQTVRGEFLDAQYQRESALIDLQELGAVPGATN